MLAKIKRFDRNISWENDYLRLSIRYNNIYLMSVDTF